MRLTLLAMTVIAISPGQAGKTCPYCRFPLKAGVAAEQCDGCETIYHAECWLDGEGCGVLGCSGAGAARGQRRAAAGAVGGGIAVAVPPVTATPRVQIDLGAATGGRRRRGGWIAVGIAAGLIAVGAGVGLTLVLTHQSAATRTAEITTTTVSTTASPPQPSPQATYSERVARRLDQQVVQLQNELSNEVVAADESSGSFDAMRATASSLQRAVLRTQGWSDTLPVGSEASVRRSVNIALNRESTYAAAIASIPAGSTSLTRTQATDIIAKAGAAERAANDLAASSPEMTLIPVRRDDHLGLKALVPQAPPPSTTAPPPPPPPPSSVPDENRIKSAITGHWKAIDAGDYAQAYSFFSPGLMNKNPRSSWIQDKYTDQPHLTEPMQFSSINVHGSTAEAYVSFATVGQDGATSSDGCHRSWSNYYEMALVGGRWYIDGSKLTNTSYGCTS
jgi:hypothetical protein